MSTILLAGVDGYIGTALVQRLLKRGHEVIGIDNQWRRFWAEDEAHSYSSTKILSVKQKTNKLKKLGNYRYYEFDIAKDADMLDWVISKFKPSTIINLAHNPSAPYSMRSRDEGSIVLMNNIIGTNNFLWSIRQHCPNAHYITVGTTSEYSHYSNIDIEEGYFSIEYKGRQSEELIYPRRPGSIYHTSKTASTYLIDFLSRTWNLRCTDIMQSIVFGAYTDEIEETKLRTRFDSDEMGGTVINRFIVQAILGEPLTIYGKGEHQRGFISLNDSIQALEIAVNNPPNPGRPQVWNQLSFWQSINSLAEKIQEIGKEFDLDVQKQHIETPRNESTEDHYYKYICEILPSLGYKPTRTLEDEIRYVFNLLLQNKKYLEGLRSVVIPKISFK